MSEHQLLNRILERLDEQQSLLNLILERITTMSTTAVTRDQLDAALNNLLAAEAARDAAVIQALTDLAAKVAAGTVTTPEDFTAELATVTTRWPFTNAAARTPTATSDDPGPTTVPTTPSPPATDSSAATTERDTTRRRG